MDPIRVIEVKESIFADNNADADRLRAQLKEQKTFLLNLMSSPGSGKTTTLKQVIGRLKDEMQIGVMEADIDSDVGAAAEDRGLREIQTEYSAEAPLGCTLRLDWGEAENRYYITGREDGVEHPCFRMSLQYMQPVSREP